MAGKQREFPASKNDEDAVTINQIISSGGSDPISKDNLVQHLQLIMDKLYAKSQSKRTKVDATKMYLRFNSMRAAVQQSNKQEYSNCSEIPGSYKETGVLGGQINAYILGVSENDSNQLVPFLTQAKLQRQAEWQAYQSVKHEEITRLHRKFAVPRTDNVIPSITPDRREQFQRKYVQKLHQMQQQISRRSNNSKHRHNVSNNSSNINNKNDNMNDMEINNINQHNYSNLNLNDSFVMKQMPKHRSIASMEGKSIQIRNRNHHHRNGSNNSRINNHRRSKNNNSNSNHSKYHSSGQTTADLSHAFPHVPKQVRDMYHNLKVYYGDYNNIRSLFWRLIQWTMSKKWEYMYAAMILLQKQQLLQNSKSVFIVSNMIHDVLVKVRMQRDVSGEEIKKCYTRSISTSFSSKKQYASIDNKNQFSILSDWSLTTSFVDAVWEMWRNCDDTKEKCAVFMPHLITALEDIILKLTLQNSIY